MTGQGEVRLTRGQGTHVHPVRVNGVHADAVPEQGSTGLSLRGIDAHQGDALVGKVQQEPAHQLVHHGGFASPARPCDAEHWHLGQRRTNAFERLAKGVRVVFGGRDAPGEVAHVALRQPVHRAIEVLEGGDRVEIGLLDEVVDHALKPHGTAVVGMVNPGDAVVVKLLDFLRENGSSASTKNPNVPRPAFVQEVLHVLEVLHVSALVGGHGDRLGVFLNGGGHHLVDAAVVPEMDDFTSGPLHDAAHDVDRGIVTVKQAGGRDDSDFVLGGVGGGILHGVAWNNAKLGQTPCRPSHRRCVRPRHAPDVTVPRPAVQNGVPSLWHACLQAQDAFTVRMLDLEAAGVKHQRVGPCFSSHEAVVLFVAVTRVSHNRVPQMAEVEADLVKTASLGPTLHQAVPRRLVGAHRVVQFSPRQRCVVGSRFLGLGVVGGGQGFLHDALVFRPSANHGPVHLGRSAVHKLQLQGIQRVAGRGEEDNAARRLVQAMHRLQPCFPRPCFVDEVAQIERLVKIDVRPVHQQAVGFHHGAHVFILVQDVECRFCT